MNRIKDLRKQQNISQDELSETLNVQRATISRYETGTIPLTADTIIRLAQHFKVTTDYLLCNSNDHAPASALPIRPLETKEQRFLDLYRETAPEIRAAVDKLLETYAWAMAKAADINKK